MQSELERALAVVLRRPEGVPLTVAGRTDAGVHAWAQVASHPGEAAPLGSLNALLPPDVAVLGSEPAPDGFDARYECTSRAYCYRVIARPARSALDRGHALHWTHPVDLEALRSCAALLVGTHDFTAFTPTDTYHVRFDRDVFSASWHAHERGPLEFWIEADTFMRHMNRTLVGTMLEVARGRRPLDDFARAAGGPPAGGRRPDRAGLRLYFAGAGYRGERVLA